MSGISLPPNWDDPPGSEWPAEEWQPELDRYPDLDLDHPADRALWFFQMLPHTKGEWANKDLRLGDSWAKYPKTTRWQRRLLRHVFGDVDEDGRRNIRETYVEIPKGAGKTFLAAGVGLYLTFLDGPGFGEGEQGAEVYSAALKKEQAMRAWDQARQMVRRMPPLNRRADIKNYRGNRRIGFPETNSYYEPLPRDAEGQQGINPHGVIFDELHTQPDSKTWDNFVDSMGKRREPLLFAITTAGYDRESVCYNEREYTRKVNEGTIEDEGRFGVIFAADEDDDWTDPEVWHKANPNLGVSVSVESMQRSCSKAQEMPSRKNQFKRKRLNIWTRQETKWIETGTWRRAQRDYNEHDLKGRPCFGGVDYGKTDDLTAWVLAFPEPDDPQTVKVLCRAWCPEERLHADDNIYSESYINWKERGWLKTVPGEVMDYRPVKQKIVEDTQTFDLIDLAVDRHFQGHQQMIELQEDEGISVVSMRTTYTDMTSPCDEFERRLRHADRNGNPDPQIIHNGNPVLEWAVSNAALKQPDEDRKRPVKDSKHAKIDPLVALLMALDRAMRKEETMEQQTDYSDGLLVLG